MPCWTFFIFMALNMYLKWVDNFIIFYVPIHFEGHCSGSLPIFNFDLGSLFGITGPLCIPWNPIEKKGQYFTSSVKYVGFLWDLKLCRVSLPDKKHVKLLSKIHSFLSVIFTCYPTRMCFPSWIFTTHHLYLQRRPFCSPSLVLVLIEIPAQLLSVSCSHFSC